MKGLTLAEGFYREYGEPMLREQFPALMDKIAVGLVGSGSECFGFDDQISRDHDFEPGFCIFLPDEAQVDRTTAFALERAYEKLPKEYQGFTRSTLKPVGGNRHGVLRLADFLTEKTGTPDGIIQGGAWFFLPEQALAEVTNGRLFWDGSGEFTTIRRRLSYLPEEVRRKKLAGHLLLMGQAGQYNHPRCIARNEFATARLAVNEFINHTIHAVFLLEKHYLPYYKWQFRALRELPLSRRFYASLEQLLAGRLTPAETDRLIGAIAAVTAEAVQAQGLSAQPDRELERLAYAVNNGICDAALRNLHILYGV